MLWQGLSLKWKLSLPLLVITAVVLAVSVRELASLNQVKKDFDFVNIGLAETFELILNADRDLYQARVAEQQLIALVGSGTGAGALVSEHRENIDQVRDRIAKVVDLDLTSDMRQSAERFLANMESWERRSQSLIADVRSGVVDQQTAQRISFGELAEEFEAIRNELDVMGEEVAELRQEYAANVGDAVAESTLTFVVGTALVAALSAALAYFLPKMLLRPIGRISHALRALASGGSDLTRRLPSTGTDEIGKLGQTFNEFLNMLQELISEVNSVSETVSEAASEINGISAKNRATINEQFASMEMIASAIEEMGAAVTEVSSSTHEMSLAANEADTNAQDVRKRFGHAMDEVGSMARQSEETASRVRELEQLAHKIVSVVDVIQGIAEQTNLLALNAAIEAARAGEQGRGFAVVADEVRSLAVKTQSSTAEINTMIEQLQQGVNNTVQAIEQGQSIATRTVDMTRRAGDSMAAITAAISQVSAMAIQVAAAIEEQSAAVNDISEHMSNLNNLGADSNDRAQQIAGISQSIDERAEDLHLRLKSFGV